MVVYKITDLTNNKVYIGQTKNFKNRISEHFNDCNKKDKYENQLLYQSMRINGKDSFIFEIIDYAKTQDELDEKERYWIKFYNSTSKQFGYNLDTGGKSGGYKSQETRRRIGQTTLKKWENPQIAEKMLNGLKKGTEKTKEKAKNNFVEFICPICKTSVKVKQWQLNKKKVCSSKCAAKFNKNRLIENMKNATETNKQKTMQRQENIRHDIIEWAYENKEIILNCPLNKISTNLKVLMRQIENKYNIKDFRAVTKCFNVNSRKEFVVCLQNIVKENNCI